MNIEKKYSFEDYGKAFEDFLHKIFNSPTGLFSALGLLALLIALLTSFYTVAPEEEAVVTRFGKFVTTTPSGLHFKIPFYIDQVTKIKTKRVFEEGFGLYAASGTDTTEFKNSFKSRALNEESLMLTGDLNVINVSWVVQYKVSDPKKLLFHSAKPIQNIRDISQATMRRVVGDRRVDDVIRRTGIEDEAKRLTQEVLDRYDIGVEILLVKIQEAKPPVPVQPSFNEVNSAKQEQERAINEAEAHYNQIIPQARGEAEKRVLEARGKAVALVNEAKGNVEKFNKLLVEYKKAPEITRTRLYLESMESLLERMKSVVIVDPKVQGLLPVFGPGALTKTHKKLEQLKLTDAQGTQE